MPRSVKIVRLQERAVYFNTRGLYRMRYIPNLFITYDACVVCGHRLDVDGIKNHHCNPTTENRIEGGRQGSGNRDHNIDQTEGQRLSYGFHLLNINERE